MPVVMVASTPRRSATAAGVRPSAKARLIWATCSADVKAVIVCSLNRFQFIDRQRPEAAVEVDHRLIAVEALDGAAATKPTHLSAYCRGSKGRCASPRPSTAQAALAS